MWVTENEESRISDVSLREDHGGSVQDPESHVRDWRERFKSRLDKRRFENVPRLIPRARHYILLKATFSSLLESTYFQLSTMSFK